MFSAENKREKKGFLTSMISNKASVMTSSDRSESRSCSGGVYANDRSPGLQLERNALTAADLTLLIPNSWQNFGRENSVKLSFSTLTVSSVQVHQTTSVTTCPYQHCVLHNAPIYLSVSLCYLPQVSTSSIIQKIVEIQKK